MRWCDAGPWSYTLTGHRLQPRIVSMLLTLQTWCITSPCPHERYMLGKKNSTNRRQPASPPLPRSCPAAPSLRNNALPAQPCCSHPTLWLLAPCPTAWPRPSTGCTGCIARRCTKCTAWHTMIRKRIPATSSLLHAPIKPVRSRVCLPAWGTYTYPPGGQAGSPMQQLVDTPPHIITGTAWPRLGWSCSTEKEQWQLG